MLLKGTEVDMGTLDMIGIAASQLSSIGNVQSVIVFVTAYLASMAAIILCVKWSNIVKQLRADQDLANFLNNLNGNEA